MRVLVDAHLPKRLSDFLSAHDIESKHTLDLPKKNATPDPEIIRLADEEDRIVISKDSDFLDNYSSTLFYRNFSILAGSLMTAPNIYRGSMKTAGLDSAFRLPAPPLAGRPSRRFSERSLSPDDHAVGYGRVSPTIPVMVHLGAGADQVDVTGILISLPDIE